MHTHFGSATHLAATFLGVVVIGTFWRLSGMTLMSVPNRHVQGIGRAMLVQF